MKLFGIRTNCPRVQATSLHLPKPLNYRKHSLCAPARADEYSPAPSRAHARARANERAPAAAVDPVPSLAEALTHSQLIGPKLCGFVLMEAQPVAASVRWSP